MRRIAALLILILLAAFMVSCQYLFPDLPGTTGSTATIAGSLENIANHSDSNNKKTIYDSSEQCTGVTLIVKEELITTRTEEITLIFKNISNSKYLYGEDLHLEVLEDGEWYIVPLPDNIAWNAIAYVLMPGESRELAFNIKYTYGMLNAGTYRIVKAIYPDNTGTASNSGSSQSSSGSNEPVKESFSIAEFSIIEGAASNYTVHNGAGWSVSYPNSWNIAGDGYLQEEKSGKTLVYNITETTQDELEDWIDSEIKRALDATEASNSLKEVLKIEENDSFRYYTYAIESKMDGAVYIIKHTIIFDGRKSYHFHATLPPVTEEEYSTIIGSFDTF